MKRNFISLNSFYFILFFFALTIEAKVLPPSGVHKNAIKPNNSCPNPTDQTNKLVSKKKIIPPIQKTKSLLAPGDDISLNPDERVYPGHTTDMDHIFDDINDGTRVVISDFSSESFTSEDLEEPDYVSVAEYRRPQDYVLVEETDGGNLPTYVFLERYGNSIWPGYIDVVQEVTRGNNNQRASGRNIGGALFGGYDGDGEVQYDLEHPRANPTLTINHNNIGIYHRGRLVWGYHFGDLVFAAIQSLEADAVNQMATFCTEQMNAFNQGIFGLVPTDGYSNVVQQAIYNSFNSNHLADDCDDLTNANNLNQALALINTGALGLTYQTSFTIRNGLPVILLIWKNELLEQSGEIELFRFLAEQNHRRLTTFEDHCPPKGPKAGVCKIGELKVGEDFKMGDILYSQDLSKYLLYIFQNRIAVFNSKTHRKIQAFDLK
jgi:hypothetical protein